MLSDLLRVAVGENDPVPPVDDDGVDPGGPANRLGGRLQHRCGIGTLQCGKEPWRSREGLGRCARPGPGFRHAVAARLQYERHQRGSDDQHHDRQLQEEHLAGEAAHAEQRTQAPRQPPRAPPTGRLITPG